MMNGSHILKVSRLEGLTDGVFAIAMTILVFDLHLPANISPNELSSVLLSTVILKLIIYAGSFTILGTLWIAMDFQIGLLDHLNRPYLWANVFYLMVVCVVPFSASLVASYPNHEASITFYAINLLCASACQLLTSQVSHVYRLNRETYTGDVRMALIKRIFVAPIFYIAALFVVHFKISFAFALLVAPTVLYMIPGRVDKYERE